MSATQPLPVAAPSPHLAEHLAQRPAEHLAEHAARPLRVLAWPMDQASPYTASLHEQMGPGVQVDEYRAGKLVHRYDIWHVHFPEALLNIRNPALAAFK